MEKKLIFRSYQVIWYFLAALETLLAFRFLFKLSGASTASGFVRFIYNISAPFIAPFRGIYPTPVVEGAVLEWITIVAMFVWVILAYALVHLLQLVKPVDRQEIEEGTRT